MAPTRLLICWIVLASLALTACRTGPSGSSAGAGAEHRLNDPIKPPAGLADAALEPATGDAGRRAGLSLEQVIAELPRPEFLPEPADDRTITPDDRSARYPEPVLAAQRAYVEGRAAWRAGDSAEAKRRLEDALRRAPPSAEILRLLGMVYTASGNRVRGAYFLEQAAEIAPDDAQTLLMLSRFALEQRQWDESIAGLHRVLVVSSREGHTQDAAIEPLARYYLALSLQSAGYAAAAADQYDRFLRADRGALQANPWGHELVFLAKPSSRSAICFTAWINPATPGSPTTGPPDRAW